MKQNFTTEIKYKQLNINEWLGYSYDYPNIHIIASSKEELENLFRKKISEKHKLFKEEFEYFEKYYKKLKNIELKDSKIILGEQKDKKLRKCRFCNRTMTEEVTFNKRAHALPESIGNKLLFSHYECDTCNEFFGRTFENDFSNYLYFIRATTQISGKGGIPSYKIKESKIQSNQIDNNHYSINVSSFLNDDSLKMELFFSKNKLTIHGIGLPFIPANVYKCLIKMALTIMPEEELKNFDEFLDWICLETSQNDGFTFKPLKIFTHFTPGNKPYKNINILLLKRKNNVFENIPYMYLVLMFSNIFFQIFVPSILKDNFDSINLKAFPTFSFVKPKLYDFSSKERHYDQLESIDISYQKLDLEIIKIDDLLLRHKWKKIVNKKGIKQYKHPLESNIITIFGNDNDKIGKETQKNLFKLTNITEIM